MATKQSVEEGENKGEGEEKQVEPCPFSIAITLAFIIVH